MRIEVNNGTAEQFEWRKGLLIVTHISERGEAEYRDAFDEGEIIMALNLLRYMRDNDIKSALVPYGHEDEMRRYLSNLLNNGDLQDFRIFQ